MRIGIDARFWHSTHTGIGQYTKGLVHGLAKIDRENEYIVFIRRRDLEEWDVKAPNFKPIVVDIAHYSLAEQLVFPFILLSHRPDLVHFANFNHPIFYPGKFTVTIHDLAYFVFPGHRLKGRIFKWGYFLTMWMGVKRAARVIAVTKYTRDEIVRRLGEDKSKIDVIYEGVDVPRFPSRRSTRHDLKAKFGLRWPVIFYVGNWRRHKNLSTLISAFGLLRKKGVEAHLLLGGKTEPDILELISDHPHKKDIVVAGFIPNESLPDYYAAADVFVYPSLYEGFGLQILEAQHMGVPVAASKATTLPEVGGKGALYFNPLDAESLALVVSNILDDEDVRDNLIKKGYKNLKRFSWEKAAEETLRVFEGIVGK
jgi:glycosyltransferase involved in cell wall biosynthesis